MPKRSDRITLRYMRPSEDISLHSHQLQTGSSGEGENATLDRDVVKRIEDIQSLKPDIKDKLFYIIDTCIRDAKTQQAYGI